MRKKLFKIVEWLPFPLLYDDMNTYYNYSTKEICRVTLLSNKQCIHLTMSLFLFLFFYILNFYMELSKTEFVARVSFT